MFSKAQIFTAVFLLVSMMGCTSQNEPELSVEFTHEIITDDLEIPWQMDFAADGRIFITERNGYVRVVEDGQLLEEPWFDFTNYLEQQGEAFANGAGVQGIALDSDFANNGYVYVGYAYAAEDQPYDLNKLVRLKEDPNQKKGIIDTVLLDKIEGLSLHNAAQIKFGPDNKIYWSVGDQFVPELAQDLENESGSILRLNIDGSIPDDNPFADSYIYSYGHRNPQGFDWYKKTGIMMATEHGPSSNQGCCHDEINIIEAGKNYGWPEIRGDETAPEMQKPLLHSGVGEPSHDYTWAPSGASFIQSGPWDGSFLFGGLRSQCLWLLELNESSEVEELTCILDHVYHRTRSVAQNPYNGAIYLLTSNLDRINHPYGKDVLVKLDVFYVDAEAD